MGPSCSCSGVAVREGDHAHLQVGSQYVLPDRQVIGHRDSDSLTVCGHEGDSDVKAVIAALDFIVTNGAKYNVDAAVLVTELQQLGLPKGTHKCHNTCLNRLSNGSFCLQKTATRSFALSLTASKLYRRS